MGCKFIQPVRRRVCVHAVKWCQLCLTLCDLMFIACQVLCQWDSPGKNTRVCFRVLLQEILLTQGSNPSLLPWQTSLPLAPPGGPIRWCIPSIMCSVQFSSVAHSLQPHGLQHTRPPCPSPTPGACSNSCPSSW